LLDCVVVGAGVFGSWTALRLRQAGRSVALVEAIGPGNPKSSSGGASRVIRMGYGADEIYTRWAMRSLAAWKERPGFFQHTGVLWTARRGHPYGEATLQVFRKLGVAHEVLSADDVRRAIPRCTSKRKFSEFSNRKAARCWPTKPSRPWRAKLRESESRWWKAP
jgi:sarcosine oxidase